MNAQPFGDDPQNRSRVQSRFELGFSPAARRICSCSPLVPSAGPCPLCGLVTLGWVVTRGVRVEPLPKALDDRILALREPLLDS